MSPLFNAIGRVVAFFALLGLLVGCVAAGSMWWTMTHVPPNVTTPDQVRQYTLASSDHFFIAYYPLVVAGAIMIAAVIAFKPRPLTFALAGAAAVLSFFGTPPNVSSALRRQHALHPEYYAGHSTPLPGVAPPGAPASLGASASTAALPELAPPGVFYLLSTAHVETKDGVTGFPPGTEVKLVQPGVYLTPAGKVHLSAMQVTNDLGKARNALAYDRNAQAALHVTSVMVDTILEHGTRKVPVQINGIVTRNFVVDSGATNVMLPTGLVTELVENGTLTESDYLPGYIIMTIADGSKSKRRRFVLRSIRVGQTTVSSVEATDSGPNGALLLGMSFLAKANAVYDAGKGKLIFSR